MLCLPYAGFLNIKRGNIDNFLHFRFSGAKINLIPMDAKADQNWKIDACNPIALFVSCPRNVNNLCLNLKKTY